MLSSSSLDIHMISDDIQVNMSHTANTQEGGAACRHGARVAPLMDVDLHPEVMDAGVPAPQRGDGGDGGTLGAGLYSVQVTPGPAPSSPQGSKRSVISD